MRYEILPVFERDLAEVAGFLVNWHQVQDPEYSSTSPKHSDPRYLERHLRWRLIENPAQRPGSAVGSCIRGNGSIAGVILFFSNLFVRRQEKLSGLCSGSFFVDRAARTQGFLLFRKYLSMPGHDFWFGTTCNASSGALWKRLGGSAVSGSEYECIIPIRLKPIARAFAITKRWHPLVARLTEAAGAIATTVLHISKRRLAPLEMNPCRDWAHLAELAQRHRNPEKLTCERSATYLKWRYEDCPVADRKEVYLFRDEHGNEGWFAVETTLRGRTGLIRTMNLLDIVCPANAVLIQRAMSEVVRVAAPRVDMVLYGGGQKTLSDLKCRWLLRRKLDGPRSYVKASSSNQVPLAELADFALADGDSAE